LALGAAPVVAVPEGTPAGAVTAAGAGAAVDGGAEARSVAEAASVADVGTADADAEPVEAPAGALAVDVVCASLLASRRSWPPAR
jgi:hypothetical protein